MSVFLYIFLIEIKLLKLIGKSIGNKDLKNCIIYNGFNKESFIDCYGVKYSKLHETLKNELKIKYYYTFWEFFESTKNLCRYDKTPCMRVIAVVEEN